MPVPVRSPLAHGGAAAPVAKGGVRLSSSQLGSRQLDLSQGWSVACSHRHVVRDEQSLHAAGHKFVVPIRLGCLKLNSGQP